jgi:hypothetical protein
MSTVIVIFDVPGMTAAQYDQVMKDLNAAGEGSPKGRRSRVAASKDGGWLVVDVWDSPDALNQFAPTLMPILAKNGVTPPQPQVFPAHNLVNG